MNAVGIEKGASNWQIFQQDHGFADITLTCRPLRIPAPADIWGRAVREDNNLPVTTWQRGGAQADGLVIVRITGIPAGGPYRLETCMAESEAVAEWGYCGACVYHVGVGDLFLIAGQSNATGFGRTPVWDPPEMGIHCFGHSETWDIATHPLADTAGAKDPCVVETRMPGHSPWLACARELKKALGYPIGLIQASKGGIGLDRLNPHEDGLYYRYMISMADKATGGTKRLAGVLWYQGCSDCFPGRAETYLQRFTDVVQALRADVGNERLPIHTVQINKFITHTEDSEEWPYWNVVREAQRRATHTIPGVTVVPSLDMNPCDWAHNTAAANVVIGERVARAALCVQYGLPVFGRAPDIAAAHATGEDTLRIRFDDVYTGLSTFKLKADALQFDIADQRGANPPVSYELGRDALTFRLSRPIAPDCTVSFAAGSNPRPYMPFDTGSGLPLLAFDRFPVAPL